MLKYLCIAGIASAMLWSVAATAAEPTRGAAVAVGPARVVVHVEAKEPPANAPGDGEKRGANFTGRAWNLGSGNLTAPFPQGLNVVADVVQVSEFWIGVECSPADDALRAQLGLKEGQGLVANHVVPEGPAAKAGIQRFDVLLSANDKPLGDVSDLVGAIEAAKEKEVSLKLIRGGKPQNVTVVPAKRAEGNVRALLPHGEWQARDWLPRQLRPWNYAGEPLQFRFIHPPAVLPPDAEVRIEAMPGNMSVTIAKKGNEPAKITVKRGEKEWKDVSEYQLDDLPGDVRPHVERMLRGALGGGPGWTATRRFDFVPYNIAPRQPGDPANFIRTHPPSRTPNLQRQIDQMHEQLEQLRKSIEQLQKAAGRPENPEGAATDC